MPLYPSSLPVKKLQKRVPLTDLPVQSFSNWDSVGVLLQAITDLDGGLFRNPAMLWDAMMMDDRIYGVLGTRISALLGLKLDFKPADESRKAKKAADALKDQWPYLFPANSLSEYLRWGHGLAFGLGELQWERTDSYWCFGLKVWHPQTTWWNWQTRTFWMTAMEGLFELNQKGDGQFMLYLPHGAQRGWIHGLVRTLGRPWLMRQWTYRDWARYCEVYGTPIRKVKMPMEAGEKHKERMLQEAAAISTETVIRCEVPSDGKSQGFDVELVEAMSTGYMTFEKLIEQVNNSIAITVLGQNLTTEVQGGAYAAAAVHDRVRADWLRYDGTTLGGNVRDQALKYWAAYNFGDPDLAPYPTWQTDPPEDKNAKAKSWVDLGTAVGLLRVAGFGVDLQKAADLFELPLDADAPFVTPAQVGPPPSNGNGNDGASAPQPDPFGADSVANRLLKLLGWDDGAGGGVWDTQDSDDGPGPEDQSGDGPWDDTYGDQPPARAQTWDMAEDPDRLKPGSTVPWDGDKGDGENWDDDGADKVERSSREEDVKPKE